MSPETKTVYLVRHGQSEANVAPVFQGPESPLSSAGKDQANAIAGRIAKIPFETLIASPYARTRETAEILGKVTGKEPEFSELFVERIKPTSVDGKPYEDEKANALWREWETSLHTTGMRTEDGENFDDIITRADAALEFLHMRPEKTMVVVSHGDFIRTLIARILFGDQLTGQGFRNFQRSIDMENTGITVFRYSEDYQGEMRWRLWIHNDHAHLG